jgi:hypothetical protein
VFVDIEKGGGERFRVSTCVGGRGGGVCFVEDGGSERESEVEIEHVSADTPMSVRAGLVRGSEALTLVLSCPRKVTCKLPPFKLCNH